MKFSWNMNYFSIKKEFSKCSAISCDTIFKTHVLKLISSKLRKVSAEIHPGGCIFLYFDIYCVFIATMTSQSKNTRSTAFMNEMFAVDRGRSRSTGIYENGQFVSKKWFQLNFINLYFISVGFDVWYHLYSTILKDFNLFRHDVNFIWYDFRSIRYDHINLFPYIILISVAIDTCKMHIPVQIFRCLDNRHFFSCDILWLLNYC